MKISHIEHIGIAVESIEKALPYFENVLGLKCYNIEEVADQKVKTAFLKCGEVKLELLEPTSPDSTIAKYLEKKGEGMHHLAFCIEDGVSEALAQADAAGIRLIDKAPRKGAESLNIAFLHPKSTVGILTELCDRSIGYPLQWTDFIISHHHPSPKDIVLSSCPHQAVSCLLQSQPSLLHPPKGLKQMRQAPLIQDRLHSSD